MQTLFVRKTRRSALTPPQTSNGRPSPPRREQSVNHITGLDGLRGLACLIVVAYHFRALLFLPKGLWFSTHEWFMGGFLGVDIFFVLSGFLITWLLLEDQRRFGHLRAGRFYFRRALRILPALGFVLAVHALYALLTHLPMRNELWTAIKSLTFTQNLGVFRSHPSNAGLGHLWSISTEVHFYIIIPILLAILSPMRRSRWKVFSVIMFCVIMVAAWRAYCYAEGSLWIYLYTRTDTRIDSFFVGFALAFLWQRFPVPRRYAALAGYAGIVVLIAGVCFSHVVDAAFYLGGFTVVAIATAGIIASILTESRLSRFFDNLFLCMVGRVSYGLYIWHLFIFTVILRYADLLPVYLQVLLAISGTTVCTLVSWFFIERPLLNIKKKTPVLEAPKARKIMAVS